MGSKAFRGLILSQFSLTQMLMTTLSSLKAATNGAFCLHGGERQKEGRGCEVGAPSRGCIPCGELYYTTFRGVVLFHYSVLNIEY